MNLLILALLAQGASAKPVLDRYAAFANSSPSSRWEMQVTMTGVPTAKATLWLNRGKSLRFDAKWRGEDYTLVEHQGNLLELERNSALYEEMSDTQGFGAPPSKIAGVPGFAFPSWTLQTDFGRRLGKGSQVLFHGRQTVAGKAADVVEIVQRSTMGTFYQVLAIAPSGKPVQVSQRIDAPGSPNVPRVWTILNVTKLSSIPASTLNVDIPSGFVPYSFDGRGGPIEIGKRFPSKGWAGPTGTIDLRTRFHGKRTLLAILGHDCLPSQRSVAALRELEAKGVAVVMLSDARSRQAAGGRFYDPAGKKIDALQVKATPTFIMVDSAGKVTNLWEGYDPEQREQFEKEVRAAVSGRAG